MTRNRTSESASEPETPLTDKEEERQSESEEGTGQEEEEEEEEEDGNEGENANHDTRDSEQNDEQESAPPLPDEPVPPLPNEAPPDDGWEPVWDTNVQAYYFYNRFTGVTQWENPRIPSSTDQQQLSCEAEKASTIKPAVVGGYNPAIHGDYDPTAPYAQQYEQDNNASEALPSDEIGSTASYVASGAFNRFTGRWQPLSVGPENHNDENKSRRQMQAFFDVDAAANSHNGRSLKAERSAKKLSRKELKAFKEKRREKKEEKRRAWLRD